MNAALEFWISFLGMTVPLSVLAWAAWKYTVERSEERKHRRFEQFFSVTDKIGQEGGSILSKVAAVSELKRFPEYADVIARMTDAPDIRGSGKPVEMLLREFEITHEEMSKRLSK